MPVRLEGYVPYMASRLPEPSLESGTPLVGMRPVLRPNNGANTTESLGGSPVWDYEGEDVTDKTTTRRGQSTWEFSNTLPVNINIDLVLHETDTLTILGTTGTLEI